MKTEDFNAMFSDETPFLLHYFSTMNALLAESLLTELRQTLLRKHKRIASDDAGRAIWITAMQIGNRNDYDHDTDQAFNDWICLNVDAGEPLEFDPTDTNKEAAKMIRKMLKGYPNATGEYDPRKVNWRYLASIAE